MILLSKFIHFHSRNSIWKWKTASICLGLNVFSRRKWQFLDFNVTCLGIMGNYWEYIYFAWVTSASMSIDPVPVANGTKIQYGVLSEEGLLTYVNRQQFKCTGNQKGVPPHKISAKKSIYGFTCKNIIMKLPCCNVEGKSPYQYTWSRHQMETFSALLVLCAGNSPVTGEFPSERPWRRVLVLSLICAWTNDWVNNRDASDLRLNRAHYDVTLTKVRTRKTRRQMNVLCLECPYFHRITMNRSILWVLSRKDHFIHSKETYR